jgi:hypothetical protein
MQLIIDFLFFLNFWVFTVWFVEWKK